MAVLCREFAALEHRCTSVVTQPTGTTAPCLPLHWPVAWHLLCFDAASQSYACGLPVSCRQGFDGEWVLQVDVWAAGVCLFVWVWGCLPFQGDSIPDMFSAIREKPLTFPPQPACDPLLKDLITKASLSLLSHAALTPRATPCYSILLFTCTMRQRPFSVCHPNVTSKVSAEHSRRSNKHVT